MPQPTNGSPIAAHTELVHTHSRCPRCGEAVPRATATGARCRRCTSEEAG